MEHSLTPHDLRLPFPSWRTGQLTTLVASSLSPKKFLIVEAPPGTGKSSLGLSLGRLLNLKTIVLTSTKSLQDQYVGEFGPELVEARGRGNFACNVEPWLKADRAKCTTGLHCPFVNSPDCDYYYQRMTADNSREAVLNYAFWLHQVDQGRFKPELLVCDEAHLMEAEVRSHASVKFLWSTINALRLRPTGGFGDPKAMYNLRAWQQWCSLNLSTVRAAIANYAAGTPMRNKVRDLAEGMERVAFDATEDGWVLQEDRFGVEFKPVWVDQDCKALFSQADRVLLMSASILDLEMFCEGLGIDPQDTELVRVDSTFPKHRRPVFYRPVGKVSSKHLANVGAKLIQELDDIVDSHPGRGLIHTANYALARYIMEHSKHARTRLLTHTAKDRAAVLGFYRETTGTVLVSPSMGTGVDLPYDLCTFQIIAKLPFPDLGDPQIKKRLKVGATGKVSKRGSKWTNWITACNLIQTYGRIMRAEDDTGDTYILDGNFGAWWFAAVKHMLPRWFKEALHYEVSAGMLAPSVSIADQIKLARSGA